MGLDLCLELAVTSHVWRVGFFFGFFVYSLNYILIFASSFYMLLFITIFFLVLLLKRKPLNLHVDRWGPLSSLISVSNLTNM